MPLRASWELYQEIIFLQHWFDGKYVVENVIPYYDPLIAPTIALGRHLVWSNYVIPMFHATDLDINRGTRGEWMEVLGINIDGYKFQDRTDKLLRNCVKVVISWINTNPE